MTPILFALLAYTGWGAGDVFSIIASRRSNAFSATFWNLLLRAIFYSLLIPLFWKDLVGASPAVILIALFTGISSGMGYFFYMKGAKLSNPGLVGAIAGSWGGLSVLLSVLLLHETVTLLQTLAICCIIVGLVLVSLQFKNFTFKIIKERGIAYAFLAMLFWALCGTFLKVSVQKIGWFWPTYFLSLPFAIVSLFIGKSRKITSLKKQYILIPVFVSVVLTIIGEVSYNLGVGRGLITVVAPIAGSYATLSVLLSFFIFREPITKQQVVGVILALLGIVFLSFLSM